MRHSNKCHVMVHYAPDRGGVERHKAGYLLRRNKMSQNRHATKGLPVVFYC